MANRTHRYITLMLCSLLCATESYAVKAVSNIVKFRQKDGSRIALRIYGDEHFGYKKTVEGYLTAEGKDGYLHYANYNSGKLVILKERVSQRAPGGVNGSSTSIPVMVAASLRNQSIISVPALSSGRALMKSVAAHTSSLCKTKGNISFSGSVKSLVLLVEFSDVKFSSSGPRQEFDNMLNQAGYSVGGATGSASEYFKDNLKGLAINFDVMPVITLGKTESAYGADAGGKIDSNLDQFVKDVCMAANSAGIDFSQYDSDGDGKADNVAIIFAGYDQAESGVADALWARQASAENLNISYNGVKISSYTCSSELKGSSGSNLAGIGVFCHEFSHSLGLMDMYDTNGEEEGESLGMWKWLSIMDSGCYLNNGNTPPYYCAVEREMLGIGDVITLSPDCDYTLSPVSPSNLTVYKLNSSTDGEYFLFECRGSSGWDKYVGGSGVVVYHVDKSAITYGGIVSSNRWIYNNVNTYSLHQCAYILANPLLASSGIAYAFYPGPQNNTAINSDTTPALLDWKGMEMGVTIYNIKYSGGKATFSTAPALVYSSELPKAKDGRVLPYQINAEFSWTPDRSYTSDQGHWRIFWGTADSGAYGSSGVSDTTSFMISGLKQNTRYRVKVDFANSARMGEYYYAEFSTDSVSSKYPYAKFAASYKINDRIELAVMNVSEPVSSLYWRVNSTFLQQDQTYVIKSAGNYKVQVFIGYADGSTDTITKKIRVK